MNSVPPAARWAVFGRMNRVPPAARWAVFGRMSSVPPSASCWAVFYVVHSTTLCYNYREDSCYTIYSMLQLSRR